MKSKDFLLDIANLPRETLSKEIKKLNLLEKTFVLSLLDEDCPHDEIREIAKDNPKEYLSNIEVYISNKNYKNFLPLIPELAVELLKRDYFNGMFNSYLLENCFSHLQFSSLSEREKDRVVKNLIKTNQLKASVDFMKNKLNENLLFNKLTDNNELQYSFGAKKMHPDILDLIGVEYSDALEIGWVSNNGPKEEFRTNFRASLDQLSRHSQLIGLIREDNLRSIAMAKKMNFKPIKEIPSPWSSNILIVFLYQN